MPDASSGLVVKQEFDPAIPMKRLREHPRNPRRGRDDLVGDSIESNGFYGGVIVQRKTRYILAGNTRYRAMLAKGAETIPGFWVTCSDEIAERIMLADNRTSDMADYDAALLAELLDDLGGDLSGTGYDVDDFDALLEALIELDDELEPAPKPHTGFAYGIVTFKFGDISGQVAIDVYREFVQRYEAAMDAADDGTMLEDVIAAWLQSL